MPIKKIRPVILSGGSGSRLWPISRSSTPKHLVNLLGEETLFQKTLNRLKVSPLCPSISSSGLSLPQGERRDQDLEFLDPIIICNQDHRFLIAQQLQELNIKPHEIILEPCGKNTAPAIAIAAMSLCELDPEEILLVLPADHLISQEQYFLTAVLDAVNLLDQQDYLITFGIVPTAPKTGYGYIQRGEGLNQGFKIKNFIEKPNLNKAQEYLNSGDYDWNSGMFVFKAQTYLQELEKNALDIFTSSQMAFKKLEKNKDFSWLELGSFKNIRSDSIDYAVMEKTELGAVIPMNHSGWSDVGSWDALYEIGEKDPNQNILLGDVLSLDSQDCYIRAESRLVASIGVKNCIVIETKDAVLVCHKDQAQKVKNIVESLSKKGRAEVL